MIMKRNHILAGLVAVVLPSAWLLAQLQLGIGKKFFQRSRTGGHCHFSRFHNKHEDFTELLLDKPETWI